MNGMGMGSVVVSHFYILAFLDINMYRFIYLHLYLCVYIYPIYIYMYTHRKIINTTSFGRLQTLYIREYIYTDTNMFMLHAHIYLYTYT